MSYSQRKRLFIKANKENENNFGVVKKIKNKDSITKKTFSETQILAKHKTNIPTYKNHGKISVAVRGVLKNTPLWISPSTPLKNKTRQSFIERKENVVENVVEKNEEISSKSSFHDLMEKWFSTLYLLSNELKNKKVKINKLNNKETFKRFSEAISELREVVQKWMEAKESFSKESSEVWLSLSHELELERQQLKTLSSENQKKIFELEFALTEKENNLSFVKKKETEFQKRIEEITLEKQELKEEECQKKNKELNEKEEKIKKLEEDLRNQQETKLKLEVVQKALSSAEERIKNLQREVDELTKQLENKRNEFSETISSFSRVQQANQIKLFELQEENKTFRKNMDELHAKDGEYQNIQEQIQLKNVTCLELENKSFELMKKLQTFQKQCEDSKEEMTYLTHQLELKKEKLEQQKEEISKLRANNEALQVNVNVQNQLAIELTSKLKQLHDVFSTNSDKGQTEKLYELTLEKEEFRKMLAQSQEKIMENQKSEMLIVELKKKLYEADENNRRLHNAIQDLKGKIRVFVRIRPSTKDTISTNVLNDVDMVIKARDTTYNFKFDRVFSSHESQEDVFSEVSQFVQSSLDGYNTCIIAYGQTGAGKTYTMHGHNSNIGIVQRTIQKLIDSSLTRKENGWKYFFSCNYVEVYNEKIRDLLTVGAPNVNIHLIGNEVFKNEFTEKEFSTISQIKDIVQSAEKKRSVAVTDMNESSSRSHSIFIIKIRGIHEESSTQLNGCLYLCDLAGSERISMSGVSGERLKETQNINKSLSTLTDVLRQIHSKSQHVRFRDSKLTTLLQPCFTSSGKALMIINIAPELENCNESLNSLNFGSKVNETELGKTLKNIKKI